MSSIDWSDREEMLGLLLEYVDDEAAAAHPDRARTAFLRRLSGRIAKLAEAADETPDQLAISLAAIRESSSDDFAGDPVLDHVDACVEELRRIGAESTNA